MKERALPREFVLAGLAFSLCAVGLGVAAGFLASEQHWVSSMACACLATLLTLTVMFGPGEELLDKWRREEAESLRRKRDRLLQRIEKLS